MGTFASMKDEKYLRFTDNRRMRSTGLKLLSYLLQHQDKNLDHIQKYGKAKHL